MDEGQGMIEVINPDKTVKQFSFDQVFGPQSEQEDVFNKVARPVVDSVLQGYNGISYFYYLIFEITLEVNNV